jgi:hypothetical protein
MPEDYNEITPSAYMDEQEEKQLKKLNRWFSASSNSEREWRFLARTWHDYYHGEQLTEDLKKMLQARSQPALKFNLIKSIVNLLTGQEIQGRTDIKFVGTDGESDTLPAEILTDIYRQYNEEDYFQYEMTRAFQDGVIGGRGCVFEDWDEVNQEIFREYVDWQEIFVDACAKRVDNFDARHIFRAKWVDLDVAIEMFPDSEDELKRLHAAADTDSADLNNRNPKKHTEQYFDDLDDASKWVDPERERVKIVECWYKETDPKTKKPVMMHCIFSDNVFVATPAKFGRNHEQFPIIFTYYNKDRKGIPYGLVKDLVDPQDVINRSFSKSMHILGTRQILAEKGALPNIQKVQTEINKPDAVINDFEDGSLANGKVRIEENRGDAQMAFQHFEIGVNAMHRISGVNPENMGLHSNARSGTAISMRLRQGNTVLTSLYDCLEKTKKKTAEIFIYLMSQYMTNKEVMRYKLSNGEISNIEVNTIETVSAGEALYDVNARTLKDIFKYDAVITESAKSANADEAQLNGMIELLKVSSAAQQSPAFQAELIKSTSLANKEEMARAIMPQPQQGPDVQATQ